MAILKTHFFFLNSFFIILQGFLSASSGIRIVALSGVTNFKETNSALTNHSTGSFNITTMRFFFHFFFWYKQRSDLYKYTRFPVTNVPQRIL